MWILLKPGDAIREGDESFYPRKDVWVPMAPHITYSGSNTMTGCDLPIRRELKGWEAVKYALEQEVLGNDVEGCETVPWLWDCECEEDFIRVYSEFPRCPKCKASDSDQPNSRKAEVILHIIDGK